MLFVGSFCLYSFINNKYNVLYLTVYGKQCVKSENEFWLIYTLSNMFSISVIICLFFKQYSNRLQFTIYYLQNHMQPTNYLLKKKKTASIFLVLFCDQISFLTKTFSHGYHIAYINTHEKIVTIFSLCLRMCQLIIIQKWYKNNKENIIRTKKEKRKKYSAVVWIFAKWHTRFGFELIYLKYNKITFNVHSARLPCLICIWTACIMHTTCASSWYKISLHSDDEHYKPFVCCWLVEIYNGTVIIIKK